MDFLKVLNERHSVRHFDGNPVSEDTLVEIVRQAQRAPSWVNAQEWKVVIATGATLEAIRKEYSQMTANGVKGAPDFPVAHRDEWSEDAQTNMKVFSDRRIAAGLLEAKETSQQELFHAPAVAYLLMPKKTNFYAVLDMGGFEQTLLLAAKSLGVDSVPAYNLIKYPDVLRRILGVGEDIGFVIGIALGYPAEVPLNDFRSTRREVEEILMIKR